MSNPNRTARYLHDYRPAPFCIDRVDLRFDLDLPITTVSANLSVRRNPVSPRQDVPLLLDGVGLELVSIRMNATPLGAADFSVEPESLILHRPPDAFELEVQTCIRPGENTALEGLYQSSGNFCTQCEAEGFRKITYFSDRPDVMSRYSTTIVADRSRYPVLLSNGNLVTQGQLEARRHWARWDDPFPKPSYLFALVAGALVCVEDSFTTRSGREVELRIYVQESNADRCEHAMQSLKKAMRWDEEVFGLEYDLDIYMIVAVDDFNMGAMENKGLNLFNSKYVLAKPETATDSDYQRIEGVVGHEYFHNWTGNRVTCRDWFQLSLKEGLTVFRDQEFSADTTSRAVKRIDDVRVLRAVQFAEDAGPMAHPVRPESYIEINNFYTATVYNKGAEVIRMLHTLLGPERFCAGLRLYLERHDGQAVTTDDFVQAMEDTSGIDLEQFRLWYSQAGTPELEVSGRFDPERETYELRVRQSCPATPGQPHKQPFHIPLVVGLLSRHGGDLPLTLEGEGPWSDGGTRVLELRTEEQTFRFLGLRERPIPSLLRGFSAPVRVRFPYSREDLAFLLARDADPFNRWEAGQRLAIEVILELVAAHRRGEELVLEPHLLSAARATLADRDSDEALLAEALTLPSERYLGQQLELIDVEGIHRARRFVRRALAEQLAELLLARYRELADSGPYRPDPRAVGRRRLRNLCLGYLVETEAPEMRNLAREQYARAHNMTDILGALEALADTDCPERTQTLADFYERWRDDPLVVEKWLSLQASSSLPGTLETVKALQAHPAFAIRNPNKVRSLIGAFCHGNPIRFHDPSGAGYQWLADRVLEIDPLNPQVAARLVGALSDWQRYDERRGGRMKAALEHILGGAELSPDLYEITSKSLA